MKLKKYITKFLLLAVVAMMTSCNDYLNEIPKGQKTPQTWADYNAFMKYTSIQYFEIDLISLLMNDRVRSQTQLTSDDMVRAMYLWDETIDRTQYTNTASKHDNRKAYFSAYEQMFYWNLIIEQVPEATECTEEERQMLIAQAKVQRALTYFYLTNYFADQYCEATKTKLAVPLTTSASIEAPSPQVTLEEMYAFMVKDLTEAIPHLPKIGETIVHPNKAAGLSLLARVYLTMGDYDKALEISTQSLNENDKLYSWLDFYYDDQARFDDPSNRSTSCKTDPEKENVENNLFHFASMNMWSGVTQATYGITPERAAQFEEGDTRLLTHWKAYKSSAYGDYYYGIYGIEPNKGGLRSVEMYYIKAECLARRGDLQGAMDLINAVRKTRILPEFYQDWTAATTAEAIDLIMDDKANEFIQNPVIFYDYRRLNKEGKYTRTITKTYNGETLTLSPNSHLWIQPFPIEVISNPGNGTITLNVNK